MDATTQQLFAALAASLLPLAGPTGIKVASLVPALQALLSTVQGAGKTDYSIEDLVKIVQGNDAALAQAAAHIDAMPED